MLFKFTDKTRFFVALGISASVIVFIAFISAIRHDFDRNGFLLIGFGFWVNACWFAVFVVNNSDILVDRYGLCRVLYKKPFCKILWKEIALVREYSLFSKADQRDLCCLQIIPKRAPYGTWRLCGKMSVTEKLDRFDEFVAILDSQLVGHRIRIEAKINGQWEPRDRLSFRS